MAEVALASGFGSVRRFNETFRDLFGRPPATLRRTQGQSRGARPMRCRCGSPIGRPMTGTRCWRSWARAPFRASSWSRGDSYKRSIAIGRHSGVVTVAPADRASRRCRGALSRHGRAAVDHRAGAAGVRSRRRSRPDRRASGAGSGAGAAGRGAAGPARAGRVGRLRARDARDLRPADHGAGGDQAARQAGAGAWHGAAGFDPGWRGAQPCLSRRRRRSRSPIPLGFAHARRAGEGADRAGASHRGRSR